MDCPHCGTPSPDGSRFCSFCGKEMTAANAAGPPSGPMPPQTFPPGDGVPPQYGPPPHEQWAYTQPQPLSTQDRIVRYFLHGIAFSILSLVLTNLGPILPGGLVLIGLCFGLVIAIVILFLIYGYLNTFITEYIWKVRMRRNLSSIFLHGLVLFIVIAVASIPSFALQAVAPGILTPILLFIVYCFVDGFLARKISEFWEMKPTPNQAQYPPQGPY